MADWPYNTATWQRLRLAHLSLSPICIGCQARGVLTEANTVDHITAISDGGAAFPGHDGLASYCSACHGAKTARGSEAGAVRTRKPRRGCNPDGTPLDPEHPWHGKSLRADGIGPTVSLQTQLVRDFIRG
ncbi:HNH endonuclease signature motif containing protein [Sphingomonas aquatilis]|uniref:HNH endonuclease signature motif containing protein n=1 Tax=Sphingomonas aquatilis TaxID=93063 RepID=UPI003C6FB50B